MDQEYSVMWEIEVVAASPRDAAKQAREHQVREGTTAVVFDVVDGKGESTRVDLLDLAEELYPYETWGRRTTMKEPTEAMIKAGEAICEELMDAQIGACLNGGSAALEGYSELAMRYVNEPDFCSVQAIYMAMEQAKGEQQ